MRGTSQPKTPGNEAGRTPIAVACWGVSPGLNRMLGFALEEDSDLRLVASLPSDSAVLDELVRAAPDVVVVDIDAPPGADALERISEVAERLPDAGIVALSTAPPDDREAAARRRGARAYAGKLEDLDVLRQAIRSAAAGTSKA